jgi:hypothetical protein
MGAVVQWPGLLQAAAVPLAGLDAVWLAFLVTKDAGPGRRFRAVLWPAGRITHEAEAPARLG